MIIIPLLVFLLMLLIGGYAVLITMDKWHEERKKSK